MQIPVNLPDAHGYPLISVIVLNWNGRDLLAECLRTLQTQTYPNYEVIVVDNGSADGSAAFVREQFPYVRLIELSKNVGFGAGNNVGYYHSRGEYIAFLNNDTHVSPQWLAELCEALRRYPRAGFAASQIVFYDRPDLIDTAGEAYYSVGIARKRGHLMPTGGVFDQESIVFGACAAAALYRRVMLEEIGCFDEDFEIYDDDVDLSFRARLAGWQCVYVPTALVQHRVAATMSKQSHRAIYLVKRNTLWVIWKNMPTPLLIRYGIGILSYHLISDILALLRGYGKSVAQGRIDAVCAWRQLQAKRATIQRLRRVTIAELDQAISHRLPICVGSSGV